MVPLDPPPRRRDAPAVRTGDGTSELCFLTAGELVRHYRARRLSPVEVTRAVLARIEALDPAVNAMYFVAAEAALAAAAAAEDRWGRRAPRGQLDGVPVTLKDSVYAIGMPTPNGTRADLGPLDPGFDSPATARLREHGAVLVGKTTMPDLGMIASGVSSLHGITRNPWNLALNPGGSSSGAAVAVAVGFGPLAVGSDIGGSIRIPSSFCGTVGHKPSYGRVPLAMPWQALVAGPMARSVEDAARLLTVISEPDHVDYTSLPWDGRDYLADLGRGVKGLRLGLMLDIGFGGPVHPEIRARVEAAASVLADLGARVEPMAPIFDSDPEPAFDRMVHAYAWSDFGKLPPDEQALVLPAIADWCRQGEGMPATVLTDAIAAIGHIRRRVIDACAKFDYVVSPTMGIEPYPAELPWPAGATQHNPFCFPFNLSEQPALSICCGFTSAGLPVGLQIVGRRFDDAGVLRVGHAYEAARGPLAPPVP